MALADVRLAVAGPEDLGRRHGCSLWLQCPRSPQRRVRATVYVATKTLGEEVYVAIIMIVLILGQELWCVLDYVTFNLTEPPLTLAESKNTN